MPTLRAIAGALALLSIAPHGANAACDAGLALTNLDATAGAAALEICEASVEGSPGLVAASYGSADLATPLASLPNGSLGVGILASFGSNVLPRRGAHMLALSTGTARNPGDPGFSDPAGFVKGYASGFPSGLPVEIPLCPGVTTAQPYDSVALRLTLRVPEDAHSFSFAFKFHTYDFPAYVCSSYDDVFFAVLSPAPTGGPNLAFDSQGNPITVNTPELLGACQPQSAGGVTYPCPLGTTELVGTGFDERAATAWLVTRAPVTPGSEITLDLGIFDAGDGTLDSTVLLDDFRWSSAVIDEPITTVPEPGAIAGVLAALAALTAARGPRRASRPARGTAARSPAQRAPTRTPPRGSRAR